jgi:predicted ATPase/DNA-binding CsgD family transcriptional regulator
MIQNLTTYQQSPLAGRQRELHQLWEIFEVCMTGHTHVVFVSGEPGIGKTRLLKEMAERAEQSGALVLRGGASEAEGMPPYLPFLEALGSYISMAPPEQLHAQADPIAPILAMILPELPRQLGKLTPSYPLPPEQERLRLYEAVGQFLSAIAASKPLLLLLDDLHWADTATLDLFCHVAQHQAVSRICILGAYRSDELLSRPALERSILTLTRNRQLMTLTLEPLNEADVAELITHLLGVPPDHLLSKRLCKESEGNPFFLEELLRAWQETGTLTITPSHASVSLSPEVRLSASISSIIRHRFARLPQEVLETLRSATILGRTFASSLLAEVLGQDEELVEERLLTAVQAAILCYDPPELYTFSHDMLRAYLYNEVTPTRRKRIHGFIGRTLEARLDQEDAHQHSQLAYHFAHSGDHLRGASYSQLAAEQAVRAAAPFEAMYHYHMALDLLNQQDQHRGALWLALGEAALTAGAEREAVQAFEAAQSWFTHHPDAGAAARAAYDQGRAWARLEEHAAAQAALEQALALLHEQTCAERVHVLVELATLLAVSRGQHTQGMAYGQQALEMARQLGEDCLEALANRAVGNLLVRGNELPKGVPLLERAITLALAADDPAEAAECCACLTTAYFWSSRMHQMQEILLRRIELAHRCQEPYQVRHLYPWLTACAACLGNFVAAEQWFSQAETAIASLASPEPRAFLLQIRGMLAVSHHDYEAAEEYLAQAMVLFRQMGPGVLIWYLPILGWVQSLLGKREETLACLQESETLLASQEPGTILSGNVTIYLAQMALLLEDRERVARYTTRLLPFQGLFLDGLVDRILGELFTSQTDWSEAQACLSRAEEMARREDLLFELALTQVAQAQLALAQGGRGSMPRASRLFEQAMALFQEMGLPGQVLVVQAQLELLPERSSRSGARSLPAGLSSREVEVLCLVVEGKSNRQIAEDLVLSEKTVANHLARIFAKTGTDNRAAAAAFAIRSGIA